MTAERSSGVPTTVWAMTTVTVTDTIDAPAAKVWPIVSDFGGLNKIMRGIDSWRTEGEGLGMDRFIGMGGGEVVERLTWLDPAAYSFSYSILSGPLPFTRYVATVRLSDNGATTGIVWEGNFTPTGASEEETTKLANGIYTSIIKSVKRAVAA